MHAPADRCPGRDGPGWRSWQSDGAAGAVARAEACRLPSAVMALGMELEDNQRALAEHVDLMARESCTSTG